jgi:hypothetical protein
MRMTVTNQKLIHDEIKSGLNSGSGSNHSVLKFLLSILSKYIKIKIYQGNELSGSKTFW